MRERKREREGFVRDGGRGKGKGNKCVGTQPNPKSQRLGLIAAPVHFSTFPHLHGLITQRTRALTGREGGRKGREGKGREAVIALWEWSE